MFRTKTLVTLAVILTLTLSGLIYFYAFVLNSPNEKAETKGMTHLVSIYGWGSRPDEMIEKPHGVASDGKGNVFVTLPSLGKVAVFDRNGNFRYSFGSKGMTKGSLRGPLGIAVDPQRDRVYVADRVRFRLVTFTINGDFVRETALLSPVQPAVAKDRIYLTTFGPLTILSPDGKILDTWGSRSREVGGFDFPHGIVVDSRGNVYVSDTNNTRLVALNKKGDVIWVRGEPPAGTTLATNKDISLPAGLAIDEKDRLYLVDSFDYSIKVFNTRGDQIATFGGESGNLEGEFNMPDGICYIGDRTFAIADKYNNRVQIVRLTIPGEERPLENFPWWILLLAPLAMAMLRRKKFISSADFMEYIIANQKLRLLGQVAKRIYVSQDVFDKFSDYQEGALKFADVAAVRSYSKKKVQSIMDKHGVNENMAIFLAMSGKNLLEAITFSKFTLGLEDTRLKEIIEASSKRAPTIMDYREFESKYDVSEEA